MSAILSLLQNSHINLPYHLPYISHHFCTEELVLIQTKSPS